MVLRDSAGGSAKSVLTIEMKSYAELSAMENEASLRSMKSSRTWQYYVHKCVRFD